MAKTTVAERGRAYLEKYRDNGIVRLGTAIYGMPSASGKGIYEVRFEPVRDCQCVYFSNHDNCKHIYAAWVLENEANGDEKVEISRATLARLLRQA